MCFVSDLKRGLLLKEIIAPHLPGSTFYPSRVDPPQKGTHVQKKKVNWKSKHCLYYEMVEKNQVYTVP